MAVLDTWKQRVRALKRDTYVIVLASRDPRTPWYARLLAVALLAYALSPIDLIPDFVPVLGYLDDLILIPLGLALLVRLIPARAMADARERAVEVETRGIGRAGAAVIVLIWIGAIYLTASLAWWVVSGS